MIRWVGVGLLAMAVAPAMAQRACVMGEASRVAVATLLLQRKLVDTAVEDMDTSVPPALRPQIGSFKDALADFVDAMMACALPDQTAAAMQADLARTLRANQPEKPFTPSDGPGGKPVKGVYGDDLKVKITVSDKSPKLWMIELNFDIECGVDSMLLVYEAKPAGWQRLMRWQSGAYEEVSGAFGDFFTYSFLPGQDGPRFVVAHGHPWCSSRWSCYDVDLLSPQPNADKPRVVWHDNEGYVRGDMGETLKTFPGGFELRLEVGTVEGDQMTRHGINRYRVVNDVVQRVQPLARNGRDFVDEWLQLSWEDAARFSDAQDIAHLKEAHGLYQESRKADSKVNVSLAYGPVYACSDSKPHFQVAMTELSSDKMHLPAGFYQIRENGNGYTMMSVSSLPDLGCKEPNLMKDAN